MECRSETSNVMAKRRPDAHPAVSWRPLVEQDESQVIIAEDATAMWHRPLMLDTQ